MLRRNHFALLALAVAALGVALIGCGGGPTEPPEVQKARKLLEELWNTGPNGQSLMVACCEHTPGLDYCESKLDQALKTRSPQRKVDVLRRFWSWDDPALADKVGPLLDSDNELVRVQAAKILASFGEAAGLEVLEAHIRSSEDAPLNPEVCGLAAELGSQKCLEAAKQDLTADDENKSAAAANALAEIGGAEAAKVLRQGLEELHGEKRAPAIQALGQISEDPADVDRVLNYFRFRENVVAVIEALGALGGETAEEKLRGVLEEDDPVATTEAAGALARMGVFDEPVQAAFEEAIGAESSRIRFLAAEGLGQLEQARPRAAELLAQLLEDEDLSVVGKALDGLKRHATQQQMDALEQAWERLADKGQEAGYEQSMELLVVVSGVPGDRSEALLVAALDNSNWGRAAQAALGLLERHQAAQGAESAA
jgi:HEAT repeat protein